MADVVDQGVAQSSAAARLDFEASALGPSGTEREGDRCEVSVEVGRACIGRSGFVQAIHPAGRECHMGDLFIVNELADAGALEITGLGESVAIGQCEIEIGLFEREADGRQKGARAGR